jgi:hypothetical protein
VTTLQELEVTVISHVDVCAVRYEAIHARLKRLEQLMLKVGGAIIVILLGALGSMGLLLLEAFLLAPETLSWVLEMKHSLIG